ncbi:amino acid ABC transporter membrane protein 2 (PAAT family) [Stackebrandtia endophytica]|uniref:Amino acid ABC transporter membrane protein 2 (PAAT family) n=1 Tax=Stackebrandtia endophytica TaxID=1496996 RepID=A0A543B3A3_9ACTN|nr:amino acid ABC transporter permease [Stackebrandtia endophytica]TQL79306.1 amino acid ABC transporter membrane protein 2 (PAAT family) [Stackebrandtia endophytica]
MSRSPKSTVLFDALGPRGRRRARNASIVTGIVFVGLFTLAGIQLADQGFFDQSRWVNPMDILIIENAWLPALMSTLKAALLGSIGALLLGVIVGMGRVSRFAAIRGVAAVYVQFFRAMPLLLLIWIPFTIDGAFGATLSMGIDAEGRRLTFLVLGLSVYNGAVLAEILRSGINALPPGQAMAGHAIGLRHGQTMRLVVLPQAVRNMLPAVLAQLVILLKDTALGYVITYPDLLHDAETIGRNYADSFLQVLIIAAFVYFVLAWGLSKIVTVVERKTSRKVAKGAATVEPSIPMEAGAPGAKP